MTLKYRGETADSSTDGSQTLEDLYRERYNTTRARDRQVGYTLAGPHRHDLTLFADGRPVRDVLSSGQTKVVAAALRLATVAVLEHERGEQFPVLVDDVDAELDPGMLNRLQRILTQAEQVFVSSAGTRDVTLQLAPARTVWIRNGTCADETPSGDRKI
jgi:DNA replication and repair protein RecF